MWFCFEDDHLPISREESEFSATLIELMRVSEITPTVDDFLARELVLDTLKQIVCAWIVEVAQTKCDLPKDFNPSAGVFCHGSYGLETYIPSSDLDVVVIGPKFASREIEFFGQLYSMIRCHPSTLNIRCIKTAKVPLIRFKMYEVAVDVAYAHLNSLHVPKEEEWGNILEDGVFCDSIDKESLLALESMAVNYIISKSVPFENGEIFQQAVRIVKHWAKCRQVYGNVIGYFGGVQLSVMVAFICRVIPICTLARVVSVFFGVFSVWDWEDPIAINGCVDDSVVQKISIQKPGTSKCFFSNVNEITLTRIVAELQRGADITEDLTGWRSLFINYSYEGKDKRFLKIHLSVTEHTELEKWVDYAKSRFILLLKLLRDLVGMSCDPNLEEYVESCQSPSRKYNRVFLWEIIEDSRRQFYHLIKAEKAWTQSLRSKDEGIIGKVKLAVVPNDIYRSYIVYSTYRR